MVKLKQIASVHKGCVFLNSCADANSKGYVLRVRDSNSLCFGTKVGIQTGCKLQKDWASGLRAHFHCNVRDAFRVHCAQLANQPSSVGFAGLSP